MRRILATNLRRPGAPGPGRGAGRIVLLLSVALVGWLGLPAWTSAQSAPSTPPSQAPSAQAPTPQALFRKMLDAERTLEVVGVTAERIDLPGVSPDPQHRRFVLPVAVLPELVSRSFVPRLGAPTAVAGRRVLVLELHGIGPLTPDWTFWVDEGTGVRLAYRVTDANAGVVAEGRYTEVTAVRRRATPLDLPAPPTLLQVQRLERLMDPANVPKGYVPVGLKRTEIGATKVPALRLTFFDGLDALVLLVYRRQDAPPSQPHLRLASRQLGRFNVTVVGPAPVTSLQAWLDGLARGPLARPGAARNLQELGAP